MIKNQSILKLSSPTIQNKRVFSNPESFLKFYKKNKNAITKTTILPPKLGSRGFGKIVVITKSYNLLNNE